MDVETASASAWKLFLQRNVQDVNGNILYSERGNSLHFFCCCYEKAIHSLHSQRGVAKRYLTISHNVASYHTQTGK